MARLRIAADTLWTVIAAAGRATTGRENAELGEFLRTRRSQVRPQDVGLTPDSTRRRVHGLRREELARMAGVSPEYYTRLEQGRHPTASPAVLSALARALRLPDGVWHAREISTCLQGVKTLRHRLGGVLRMRSDAVTLHSSPSQVFYVMLPDDNAFETAYRKHSGDKSALRYRMRSCSVCSGSVAHNCMMGNVSNQGAFAACSRPRTWFTCSSRFRPACHEAICTVCRFPRRRTTWLMVRCTSSYWYGGPSTSIGQPALRSA